MFDKLFEKIQKVDEIESELLSIFEGKSWEYIATALYQTLNDIDTLDMCRENIVVFRKTVMKLQAKKNRYSRISVNESVRKKCGTCEYWRSFKDIYEDELEPDDIGFCRHPDAPHDKVMSSDDEDCQYIEESLKENLSDHARRELELAGMFDKDVDGSEAMGSWNNLCAEAVLELMEVFAGQGHSGFSASMTQELFSRLSRYEALTELTDSIDEWQEVTDNDPAAPGKFLHQSRRSASCFSNDEGKTYWDIDEDWNKHEDKDGSVWSGGLSGEEWKNRPMHQSMCIEKNECKVTAVNEHAAENGLKEFEYLLHHIVIDDNGKEEIHHCLVYDHVANMFEQGHLVVEKGKVTLDGKKVKDGTFHVLKGLESSQEVVWSDEEAKENKITVKKLKSGMTFKDKSREW